MDRPDDPNLGLGVLDATEDAPAAKPPRKKMRTWLLILTGLLTVILVAGGFYIIRALFALTDIQRDSGLMPDYTGRPPAPVIADPPTNFVLMGSDTRGGERGRSDVLILAHLTSARDKVYLISFPRDLYVEIPGHGKNKINAAYSFGGPALTVRTLENLLEVRMDHTAIIDFEGFVGLTNEVGGVTVFNVTESTAHGYTWPRGEVTIQGDEALAYVRQRYDLPGGDLGRAERQRAVVKALVLKLANPRTLANPVTFNNVASQIGRYFTVDDELTVQRMWDLATTTSLRRGSDLESLQAPISGFGTSPAGGAIDIVDKKRMAALADALANDGMDTYVETYGTE